MIKQVLSLSRPQSKQGRREALTVNKALLPPSALLFPCIRHQHGKKGSFLLLFKTVMLILLLKDNGQFILLQTTTPAFAEEKTKHKIRKVPRKSCSQVLR